MKDNTKKVLIATGIAGLAATGYIFATDKDNRKKVINRINSVRNKVGGWLKTFSEVVSANKEGNK